VGCWREEKDQEGDFKDDQQQLGFIEREREREREGCTR
jgi:hypothetical protein